MLPAVARQCRFKSVSDELKGEGSRQRPDWCEGVDCRAMAEHYPGSTFSSPGGGA
jgi:hypothetical protein